jgi:regulator of protease activity HflC (stomatin/prohibitin superfamily)
LIDPAIQDTVKAATAKFNAEALITRRPEVKEAIEVGLKEKLSESNINIKSVSITNFEFSQSFNSAIEAKVTAEQRALEAKNKLEQIKFEAQQKIETAKAEAESIRIQANAINSQGGADYVALKMIERWDGSVPQTVIPGSSVPFFNMQR